MSTAWSTPACLNACTRHIKPTAAAVSGTEAQGVHRMLLPTGLQQNIEDSQKRPAPKKPMNIAACCESRARQLEVMLEINRKRDEASCLGHLQKGFRAKALTRLAMSDDSSLFGTISPLLNSEGFRVSYGCGIAVSEHLTGVRDVEGLGHLRSRDSDCAEFRLPDGVLNPTMEGMT